MAALLVLLTITITFMWLKSLSAGRTHGAKPPPGVHHLRLQPQGSLSPTDGLVQPLRLEALHLNPGLLVAACTSNPPTNVHNITTL